MSRIAKSDVNQVLVETGDRIKEMAGPDGRISRADLKTGVAQIEDKTERALTETFAKFCDHRDHRAGAQLTAADVDRTVNYAKEKLVDRLDTNDNGLSKSELKKGSLIATLAAQVAKSHG